jgi:hypothetical protein
MRKCQSVCSNLEDDLEDERNPKTKSTLNI